MNLPPGQRAVEGFPRFGTHLHRPPPTVPPHPTIEISGAVDAVVTVSVAELSDLPRRQLTADFHCVAGWSAIGLRWEGVELRTFYRHKVEPVLRRDARVTHLVFEGHDGYRSIVLVEDAFGDDVLIADRLDGEPLSPAHGSPARLVSPSQYGFISTKHLCRIEVHTRPPVERYHPRPLVQLGLQIVKPHRRARVWEEERHRHLPAHLVRPIYTRLIPGIRWLNARRRNRR